VFDSQLCVGIAQCYCVLVTHCQDDCHTSLNHITPCVIVLLLRIIVLQVLCLHLKRFRWNMYFRVKVDTYVSFPMNGLNMSHYVLNNLVSFCDDIILQQVLSD